VDGIDEVGCALMW